MSQTYFLFDEQLVQKTGHLLVNPYFLLLVHNLS